MGKASLDAFVSRIEALRTQRDQARSAVSRGEGAFEEAKARLARLGPKTVKAARARIADLESDIERRERTLDAALEKIEADLEGAAQLGSESDD